MPTSSVDPTPTVFSVIVPFYNESPTLRPAVERLLKTQIPLLLQLVLVDDGSTDGSFETVEDLTHDERVIVVRKARNEGKGSAVRAGIAAADGDLMGILDADLEYDPADFVPLVETIAGGGASVAYGTRPFGAHAAFSFWYEVGAKFTSLWASLLFNSWVSDIHTCLKVAPLDVWRALELRCDGFDVDAEATAKFLKAGHRIYEVPSSYRARSRAEGKKLVWTDGLQILWTLTRVRFSRSGGSPHSVGRESTGR